MGDQQAMLSDLQRLALLENQLVETCFTRCVYNLNTSSPDQKEMECVNNCFMKNWHSNTRIAERFTQIGLQYQEVLMEEQRKIEAEQIEQQQKQRQQNQQQLQLVRQTGFGQTAATAQLPQTSVVQPPPR